MRNQRRIGEAFMLACGIGVAVVGTSLGVMPLLYGGLAIAGLAVFSAFWDWWCIYLQYWYLAGFLSGIYLRLTILYPIKDYRLIECTGTVIER